MSCKSIFGKEIRLMKKNYIDENSSNYSVNFYNDTNQSILINTTTNCNSKKKKNLFFENYTIEIK